MPMPVRITLSLLALLAFAPPAAAASLSVSAEYLGWGDLKMKQSGVPGQTLDLGGGTVLRVKGTIESVRLGLDYSQDTYSFNGSSGDLHQSSMKVGYVFPLPGIDLAALLILDNWRFSEGPVEVGTENLLLGVEALLPLSPSIDLEAWFQSSLSGRSTGVFSGEDSEGMEYGVRLTWDVSPGVGVSAGYLCHEHALPLGDSPVKFTTDGLTVGATFTF